MTNERGCQLGAKLSNSVGFKFHFDHRAGKLHSGDERDRNSNSDENPFGGGGLARVVLFMLGQVPRCETPERGFYTDQIFLVIAGATSIGTTVKGTFNAAANSLQ